MESISDSLVLGTKENLLRILPLLLVVSACANKPELVYYRGSEVEVLGTNGSKTTIRYKKIGVTQEVKTDDLIYP